MSNKLEFSIKFLVPCKIIYNALVDFQEVQQYTRAQAIVEAKEGGKYQILNGMIQGEFRKVEENKQIELLWKFGDWGSYSNVSILLNDDEDGCEVRVVQTNIPNGVDVNKLEGGWRNEIFVPMSKIRGYPINDE